MLHINNDEMAIYSLNNIVYNIGREHTIVPSKHGMSLMRNLIRVASTKITENTGKEFSELLFNAIDATRARNGTLSEIGSLGKFGFGFYSILRHIHGDNSIIIESTYNCDGELRSYQAILKGGSDNDITVEFNNVKTTINRTGTRITVNSNLINVHICIEVSKSVYCIKDIPIYLSAKGMDDGHGYDCGGWFAYGARTKINTYSDETEHSCIDIIVNNNSSFEIIDQGIGISEETLFNVLLVPSISSKGIGKVRGNYENETGLHPSPGYFKAFVITVGDITVYHYDVCCYDEDDNDSYILSMPIDTGVPLARNDILINSPEIGLIFENNLRYLIRQTIEKESCLVYLWLGLQEYLSKSSNDKTKGIIRRVMEETETREDIYFVPSNENIFRKLEENLGIKLVQMKNISLFRLEEFILNKLSESNRRDIYWNKNVFFFQGLDINITSGGFSSIIFINTDFTFTRPDWITDLALSYKGDRLYPFAAPKVLSSKQSVMHKILENSNISKFFPEISSIYVAMLGTLTNFSNANVDDTFSIFIKQLNLMTFSVNESNIRIYLRSMYILFSKATPQLRYGNKCTFNQTEPILLCSYNQDNFSASIKDVDMKIIIWINELITKESSYWCAPIYLLRADFHKKHLLNELISNFCDRRKVTIQEELILRDLSILFPDKKQYTNDDFLDYSVDEIRSRFSHDVLDKVFTTNIFRNIEEIRTLLYDPLLLSLNVYSKSTINTKYFPCEIAKRNNDAISHNFTGKQVFNMLLHGSDDLTKAQMFSIETPFQIFDAVTNSGTTKNYVNSILTELTQNSIDAIRGSDLIDSPISIGISNIDNKYTLYFQDFVGISAENIIYLLVPFLSSKSCDVTTVTGEMGTGMFNIYRQPYCSKVIIQTVTDSSIITVNCKPIISDNRVVDINYKYFYQKNTDKIQPNTIFSIILDGDKETIDKLFVDVSLFVNNVIANIKTTVVFNQQPIKKKNLIVYEDKRIIIYNVPGSPSYIFTNGVPFMPIINFPNTTLISTGLIFDIKKGFYQSRQSRTSILNCDMIENYFKLMSVWCLNNDIYPVSVTRKLLPFIDSDVDYTQCKLNRNTSFDTRIQLDEDVEQIHTMINYIIVNLKGKTPSWSTIKSLVPRYYPDIYTNCIWKWFQNKKCPSSAHSTVSNNIVSNITNNHIQRFVNIYWKIGTILESTGVISGTSFLSHADPPAIIICELSDSISGCYSPIDHTISLSSKNYINVSLLEIELNKLFTINDVSERIMTIREIPILFSIFSNTVPLNTLFHELTHAHRNNSHDNACHDSIDLTINGTTRNYTFDEGGAVIASLITEHGLYSDFARLD